MLSRLTLLHPSLAVKYRLKVESRGIAPALTLNEALHILPHLRNDRHRVN
jgi:hypothetical protein